MHLADAFIQSDLQCIQAIIFLSVCVFSMGIKPTTFALLTQCSTTEPQEHKIIFKIFILIFKIIYERKTIFLVQEALITFLFTLLIANYELNLVLLL